MGAPHLDRGPVAERQQLLILGVGLALLGGGSWWLFGPRAHSVVVIGVAALALAGVVAHRVIGRSVFLLFSLVLLAIGHMVSWLIVLLLYVTVIAGLGLVLRAFGMNRLERHFARCKEKSSMLADVMPLDAEGFRRQS